MANPINPQTQRPWSDAEMAYFRLLEANKADTGFADRSVAYLTAVAKPEANTGAPKFIQGADPYQVAGGYQEIMDAAQRDVWRQAADVTRKQLDFQKGQATGWVDGRATEEEQKRQDDIRRNPMNAALYEQERRGFRSGTGNEDPLMYQKLEGDKAFAPPAALAPTQAAGGGGGGGGGGGSSAPATSGSAAPASRSRTAAPAAPAPAPAPAAAPTGGKYYGFNTPEEAMAYAAAYASRPAAPAAAPAPRPLGGMVTDGAGGGVPAPTPAQTRERRGAGPAKTAWADSPVMGRGLKTGGEMTIGGAPHWIVDPMGKPVAALTEDGKDETVKGKGGVEVIPTDPKRKAAYTAKKKGVPGKALGGGISTASTTRPGAASGNTKATLSGRTTQSREVNARTKGAGRGDGRSRNGKTNNGRPPMPGSDIGRGDVTDKDAASVRGAVSRTPWSAAPGASEGKGWQRAPVGRQQQTIEQLMSEIQAGLPAQYRGAPGAIETPLTRTPGAIGVPAGESVTPLAPVRAMPTGGMPVMNRMGPMGAGMSTLPVREASGAVMPYRNIPGGAVVPVPQAPGFEAGGMFDSRAYGGLGGASNTFVGAGQGSRQDFQDIMLRGGSTGSTRRTNNSSVQNFVNGRPVSSFQSAAPTVTAQPVGTPTPVAPTAARPALPTFGEAFDASGGARTIGNDTAPTARYGFDKNAPIDIAARGASRGVKGLPGVQVAQPWKQAPRALRARGTFGNQLLQSYWNATGAAPEDLADRGRAAMPGQATASRSFF